jgi:hypothetical protein
VYEVSLPAEIENFLNSMAVTSTVGLDTIHTPLECIFKHNKYRARLLFWMAFPPAAAGLVLLVLYLKGTKRSLMHTLHKAGPIASTGALTSRLAA